LRAKYRRGGVDGACFKPAGWYQIITHDDASRADQMEVVRMTGDRAGRTTRRNSSLPSANSVAGINHSFKDGMPDISLRMAA
jgi:hypothetical protein